MIGSLCSGSGVLDIGLCQALDLDPATSIAWHAEVDPGACVVLDHHWPTVPNLGDIKQIDWREVTDSLPAITWLTAGYP